MSEGGREILDLLAREEAPDPRPDFADEIVAAGRARRRRTFAITVASVAVAAVLATATVIQTGQLGGAQDSDVATAPEPSSPTPSATSPTSVRFYAAAIEHMATEMQLDDNPWPMLYIQDHTCPNVLRPAKECGPSKPLTQDVQTGLTQALQSYAPVEFIANPDTVRKGHGQVINGGVLVSLGPLEHTTEGEALVSVAIQRGGLFGKGHRYRVSERNGSWVVELTRGPHWIS